MTPPTTTTAITWPQVAMRIVSDIPHYGAIAILGILALRGSANTQDFIIGSLATLGFKSWPRPVSQVAGAVMGLVLFGLLLGGR